ncbi:hypothetical protein BH11ACT7_BH11ACT7_18830 [soil metagenome]
MSQPEEPTIIADAGRLVIAEDGPRVLVIDRGRGPSEITTFVLVMVTLICGTTGTVSLFYAAVDAIEGKPVVIGAVFLAGGLAAGAGMLLAARSLRSTRLTQLSSLRPVAVFDREQRVFLDSDGKIVAPLDQVRFVRRGSAAANLVATTPAGDQMLLRGSLFSGTIGNLDVVLTNAVHGPL